MPLSTTGRAVWALSHAMSRQVGALASRPLKTGLSPGPAVVTGAGKPAVCTGRTWPASWKPADENAAIEIWLTIQEATAVCGIRLSDRTMRHRTYKFEHFPASLRPTVAGAMVRLAGVKPGDRVVTEGSFFLRAEAARVRSSG